MRWLEDAGRVRLAGDPISQAVEEGLGRRNSGNEKDALAEARTLVDQARRDGAWVASLPRALSLVQRHPTIEELQVATARLIAESGSTDEIWTALAGVHERFPDASEPYRMLVRHLLKVSDEDCAEAFVRSRFPDVHLAVSQGELLSLAAAEEELKRPLLAEECLKKAVRHYPDNEEAWRRLAKLQRARGGLMSAERTLADAAIQCPTPRLIRLHAEVVQELHAIESFAPDLVYDDGVPVSVKAMQGCIDLARRSFPRQAEPPAGVLGSVVLVSGSLGAGGAERQLVATAIALERMAAEVRLFDGPRVMGPINVVVRSLSEKNGNSFFLPTLKKAGVLVTEYARLEPFGGDVGKSRAQAVATVAHLLPTRMREGVTQLVEYLRYESPDVVHIWQDGMVFAAGLAAVLAGVPRIVLSARTLPPSDRVNRSRVELRPLYRALLATPGVVLTANSAIAARRYEHWLDLPARSVAVVHNGVVPPASAPADADIEKWDAFEARTAGADFTLGCVMRMDSNKRPLEWLLAAERLHARHPGARFIMIGGGPLMGQAQELAARLGLHDRVLFGAKSAAVGYWLQKMDALLLMSRYEGTPNVLIEAQLSGVPVVTTPAGGAAETLIPGLTGYVLSSAEKLDLDETADRLMDLVRAGPEGRAEMGVRARGMAQRSYSVDAMIKQTLDVFLAPMPQPMIVSA